MKKTCFVLLVVLIGVTGLARADSLIKDIPSLRVVAEEVSPEPVEPGQDLTIKVRVYNDYIYGIPDYSNGSLQNASVFLEIAYPFYLKTGHNLDQPDICTGCSQDYTYYLAVDAGAVSGLYPLNLKVSRGALEREYNVSVKVVGVPDVVYSVPAPGTPVQAGSGFSVAASFQNIGTGAARNIKVSASSDKFVMLGSQTKVIASLKPGAQSPLTLSFDADESVATGSYSIPLSMSYVDETGRALSGNGLIGIKVVNAAKLGIESLKTTPDIPVNEGSVQVEMRVENMGKGDADNVKAALSLPDGSVLVSYLGKLKPDDDAPAVFSYTPQKAGNYTYKVAISFEDDYGLHSSEETVTGVVSEKPNGNQTYYMAAAAIVLIVAAVALSRRK